MSAGVTAIDVQAGAAAVLGWIGQALVFGTVVAGLTWLLIRLLRGWASPALVTALWSIVLIKFLIPIGPGWTLSLASTWERLSLHATGMGGAAEDVAADLATGAVADADERARTEAVRGTRPWPWTTIVAAGYVLAVAGLGVARIRSYRAFRSRCLALPAADEATRELVRDVCRRLGVHRVPLVRISDVSRAPFVMGLVRPLLVLSRRQLVRPDEVETVVVHEVTHLRRGDMFVRCLQCVAGTLLFFWPVVAWVNRRIDRAREHACDEWALRHGRLTASEYARCLLSAVQPWRAPRLAYRPACMAGSPSSIERRIDVILALSSRPGRRGVWGLLAVAVLLAWGGFTLTGAAQANDDDTKVDKPQYLATEKDMRRHAKAVYARVNQYAAGDLDGDGEVVKEECWAFVTAVVLQQPEAVLRKYPEADHNGDGTLDGVEAYGFVRGDHELAKVYEKTKFAMEEAKKAGDMERAKQIKADTFAKEMETYHFILDRRDQLLDMMESEPSLEQVKAVAAEAAAHAAKAEKDKLAGAIAEVAGLKAKAAKLRAKAAELEGKEASKYQAKAEELEAKAAEIKANVAAGLKEKIAKLEAAGDEKKAAELRAKLAELESE